MSQYRTEQLVQSCQWISLSIRFLGFDNKSRKMSVENIGVSRHQNIPWNWVFRVTSISCSHPGFKVIDGPLGALALFSGTSPLASWVSSCSEANRKRGCGRDSVLVRGAWLEGWGCSATERRGCCSLFGCGLVESRRASEQLVHAHIRKSSSRNKPSSY